MSALRHAAFLALASLRHAWKRSALLVVVLGLSLGLPVALSTLLETASRDMRARAAVAPLVLGAKGSESDLVFGALFFATRAPDNLAMRDLARVETRVEARVEARETDRDPAETRGPLAFAVPIILGATARKTPVVGTTLDYFDRRGLAPERGAFFATISDCVVGAGAARAWFGARRQALHRSRILVELGRGLSAGVARDGRTACNGYTRRRRDLR